MNIKRAKEEIKDAIEAYFLKNEFGEYEIPTVRQRPVLLLGAPGIGKTQIMEQIAQECRVGLVSYTITHHTRQSAIGLPFISQKEFDGKPYSVTEYTMSEIIASVYEKIEKTGLREGILFIDEINCVSETLAPAMLQFLQGKTFGNHVVPEGWVIVAAGNPPEYNKSVREFDVVTMDRVRKLEVEPDYQVWKEYAYLRNIHPAVISYLNTKPSYFYQMERTVDGKRFATPRGWEDLSGILTVYEALKKTADREVIQQYIQHPKLAKDFANYLELYYKYQTDYQIEEVLKGHMDEILLKKIAHASFDERLSVLSLFLARCMEHFRQVSQSEAVITRIFTCLKEVKEGLTGIYAAQPELCLQESIEALIRERGRKKEAEILTRSENMVYEKAIARLESYQRELRDSRTEGAEEFFAQLRQCFIKDRTEYEEELEAAGIILERSFDFLEAAFGDGQEMVIFITELNASYYSVAFLKGYECQRYYQYNEKLLFEKKGQELLNRIDELI